MECSSSLAHVVIKELTGQKLTIAAAESLTAGLFCATLASVPGASAVLRGGLVVYATDLKHQLAGVSTQTLQRVGAVAEDTARELPVGTVFIGVALPEIPVCVRQYHFTGSRQEIREQSVSAALSLVHEHIQTQ